MRVKPDWKMPTRTCCDVPCTPTFHFDGDDAILLMECEVCDNIYDDVTWPFVDKWAGVRAFIALGFKMI